MATTKDARMGGPSSAGPRTSHRSTADFSPAKVDRLAGPMTPKANGRSLSGHADESSAASGPNSGARRRSG
jgi:hypothetical protein